MKPRTLATLLITLLVAVSILGYFYYDETNRDFSPWMSTPELAGFIKSFDASRPAGTSYWDNHWITAAEGRWHGGMPQYRIRYTATPPNEKYTWRWFVNEDQSSFGSKLQQFADDGFVLVYDHHFKRPDGTTRYQGVWHKHAK